MALNPSIILQGQGVQPVNALAQGAQAGQMVNDIRHTNSMRDMYQEHGAGIAAGEQNAMNAFAAYDPQAALSAQSTQLGMANTRQGMDARAQTMQMQLRQEARQVQVAAQAATAEQRAALRARLEQAVSVGTQIQDEQSWDAYMKENAPEYVGRFGERELIISEFRSLTDNIARMDAQNAPVDPTEGAPSGYIWNDPNDRTQGVTRLEGMQESGPLVTVNTGDDPDKFRDKLDEKSAEMFTTLYDNLPIAQAKIGQVENLAALMETSPTGAWAAAKSWLGNFGIATEGLSDVQALEAAINQMVPAQRTPGSGPMSDADLALFKRSLPRLINTPEGNSRIIQTMRGMAEYEAAQARIAAQVVSGQLNRTQGQDALMALPNPLAGFRDGGGSTNTSTAAPQSIGPQAPPAAGTVVDGYRFKGGDPSQQSNWEQM